MKTNRIQWRNRRPQGSLNVCLFTDSLEPSGLGEHMLTLAAELLPHYRVLFVCPPHRPRAEAAGPRPSARLQHHGAQSRQ